MFCVKIRSTRDILTDILRNLMGDANRTFSREDPLGDRAMLEKTLRTFSNDTIRYVYILPEELHDGMTFGELLAGCNRTLFEVPEEVRKRCEAAWEMAERKETV